MSGIARSRVLNQRRTILVDEVSLRIVTSRIPDPVAAVVFVAVQPIFLVEALARSVLEGRQPRR